MELELLTSTKINKAGDLSQGLSEIENFMDTLGFYAITQSIKDLRKRHGLPSTSESPKDSGVRGVTKP